MAASEYLYPPTPQIKPPRATIATQSTTTRKCLLCQSPDLTFIYTPKGTRRNAKVFICEQCSLLQSSIDGKGDGVPRASCLADYGNLRTGKLGRSKPAIEVISQYIGKPDRVLDVGASRGEFIQLAKARWGVPNILGIEPDDKLDYPLTEIRVKKRIEDCDLSDAKRFYDLIYMSHTLEHLDDPLTQLRRLSNTLTDDGIIYIEVPNTLYCLQMEDVVEEFFLDKHTTHWTIETLKLLMLRSGLDLLEIGAEKEHLWAVGRKGFPYNGTLTIPGANRLKRIVSDYTNRLTQNTNRLQMTVKDWQRDNAVAWGAGRILDALYRAGLDITQFDYIVDTYSPLKDFYGIPIVRPEQINGPETILICTRSEEVENLARFQVAGAEIIYWGDFLR